MSVNTNDLDGWLHSDVQLAYKAFVSAMMSFRGFEPRPRLLVAVSGGADSMSLCLMAQKWVSEQGGEIQAVIVDHRLRPESTEEALLVRSWLLEHGISTTILTWAAKKPSSAVQEAARQARYALLEEFAEKIGILHLLLGQHADDQRETVAMRLARLGAQDENITDLVGTAGMPAVNYRDQVRILRPLLQLHKSQLLQVCRCLGQLWVEDPSNQSHKYERNRVRSRLLLSSSDVLKKLDRQIEAARQQQVRLQQQQALMIVRHVRLSPLGIAWVNFDFFTNSDFSEASRRLSLARILQCVGGRLYAPSQQSLQLVCEKLRTEGRRMTLGGCVLTLHREGVMIIPEMRSAQSKGATDTRYVGEECVKPETSSEVLGIQTWLKSRTRGEDMPSKSIVRRFPVKSTGEEKCLIPCLGYSLGLGYDRAQKDQYIQKGSSFRFSPQQSLTYCREWLALPQTDIMS